MVALAQWLKVLLLCPHYTHLSRELNSFSSSEVIQKGLESVTLVRLLKLSHVFFCLSQGGKLRPPVL